MSQPAAPTSAVEINARLAEIGAQRDMAQNRCIVLAGRNAELLDIVTKLQDEIKLLKGETDEAAADTSGSAGAA